MTKNRSKQTEYIMITRGKGTKRVKYSERQAAKKKNVSI